MRKRFSRLATADALPHAGDPRIRYGAHHTRQRGLSHPRYWRRHHQRFLRDKACTQADEDSSERRNSGVQAAQRALLEMRDQGPPAALSPGSLQSPDSTAGRQKGKSKIIQNINSHLTT